MENMEVENQHGDLKEGPKTVNDEPCPANVYVDC